MGTVKYTGPVASFHCPTNAEIRSLKVHFSPKQEGTGDPSPENIRPIVGWDRVEVHESRKNMGHVIGYSALASINRTTTNNYGTTINTINYEGIDGKVIITQTQAPNSSVSHYQNGYIVFYSDNLIWGQKYNISFRVSNITSNPLNTTINNFKLINPYGNQTGPIKIIGDRLYYKITNKQRADTPKLVGFDIRICGMSCTISDIMITSADNEDEIYEPYTDKRIVTWNQWLQPLTSDNWQAYNTSKINTTFEDGIATSTWLTNDGGYNTSVRNKVGTLQKNKEIWYISYMIKSSMSGGTWGVEYNGGLQNTIINNLDADTWLQCSEASLYWRGNRNYVYLSYYRSGINDHIGMVAQIKSPIFINLTQMFGLGNEPTKEEFEAQCVLNGIDLTSALPYNEGTVMEWKTNGEEIKSTVTFPILGKNKFNINSLFAEPNDTTQASSTKRIFQPYTYCLGLSSGNGYLPSKITNISITNGTLSFTSDNTSYGVAFATPLLYGTYRLSYTGENVSVTLVRYDKNGQMTYSGSYIDSQGIFTVGKDANITCIIFRSTTANTLTTVTNIQLEEGTATTAYEPYDPKHTVYGGWVDLVSGEVCETYSLKTFNGSEQQWLWSQSSNGIPYITIDTMKSGTWYSDTYTICDTAIKVNVSSSGVLQCLIGYNNKRIYFYNATSVISDVTDLNSFTNWLSTNNISITYPLETPFTYHLSPTQLQTFLGQNNVWSNADYVEVEYDLYETQNILARKQFIMAHQPHIETAASSFTTDLRAPLKSAKIYFNPVQTGTGDPSPSNVRPITGWTGLSLYHSGENLYVPNLDNKGYINASGVIKVDNYSTYTDLIPVTIGDTYSFRCTTVSVNGETNRRIHGYDSNGDWVQQISMGKTAANTVEERTILATIPSGISYIRVSFRNEDTNVRIAKENVYEKNWEDEVGTVYGGYVDLVTGEVVREQIAKTFTILDSNQTTEHTNTIHYRFSFNVPLWGQGNATKGITMCNVAPYSYTNNDSVHWYTTTNNANGHVYFWLPKEFSNTDTITVVATLYIPQTIVTLTPTQLNTLRGTNNIWSNANGDIELKYWTH